MRLVFTSLLMLGCLIDPVPGLASGAGVILPKPPALFADFDNKPMGPIDTRGGVFGEPVSLGTTAADVVTTAPGQNVLRISNNPGNTSATRMRWQLLDDAEISNGEVKISFDFTPSALDRFSFVVRESGSTAKNFLTLTFTQNGTFSAIDASGVFAINSNTYAANVITHIDFIFDMDARTSSIVVNGTTVGSGRAFGIADRGIGSLALGYGPSSNGSAFDLDNLAITGPLPFPVVLEADFQDKTVGQPIGTGGAQLHEPFHRDSYLDAIVTEPVSGIVVLDLSASDLRQTRVLRWQFLDNFEPTTGLVVLDFNMAVSAVDSYSIGLRESTSSAKNFTSINFQPTGTIVITDANGAAVIDAGNYNAGQVYSFRIIHNLDAGTYDVFLDGLPLLRERAHGITTRGLGAMLFGIAFGASTSSHMQIDSLHVQVSDSPEAIFTDGFE